MTDNFPFSRITLVLAISIVLILSMPSVDSNAEYGTEYDVSNTNPILPESPSVVSGTGDAYGGSGDWVINQYTEYTYEGTIEVYGSVLIESNGTLVLQGTQIELQNASSLVNVSDGGYLKTVDGSAIAAAGVGYYNFSIYGNVSLSDTNVRDFDKITMDNGTLNATFVGCEFQYGTGQILMNKAHSVQFDNCDFHDTTCPNWYLLRAEIGVNEFIIEDCRFGSFEGPGSVPAPQASRGMIFTLMWNGDVKILSNDFYEVNSYGGTSGHVIRIDAVGDNGTIAGNQFFRCGSNLVSVIQVQDDNVMISENRFFSNKATHTIYLSSANDTICEKNLLWNNSANGIYVLWGNSTVRWNTVFENTGTGIILNDADGALVHGNGLYENSLGLRVQEDAENPDIYLNAFLGNGNDAIDEDGGDPISWDNGTHGNLWGTYTGVDTNNSWVGNTNLPFNAHENITDDHPTLMIGALPPSSGKWQTDIPNIFGQNNLTINGNVEVTGPSGNIMLLSNSLKCGAGNTFSFGENTIFYLQDAEITTVDPTEEMGDFHFTDVFYFGAYQSSISNIRRWDEDDVFTVSSRFIDLQNNRFTNIPGMIISEHSDYEGRDHWTPIGHCTIENNIFEDVKTGTSNLNAMKVEWPRIDFINNTISAEYPGRTVTIEPYISLGMGYDQYVNIDACNIVNASLNVTAVGSLQTTVNITNCEFGEGVLATAMETTSPYTPEMNIVNNTLHSGEFRIKGLYYIGTQYYLDLVLDNNTFFGECQMRYIASGMAHNNTFNDFLLLSGASNFVFSDAHINGEFWISGDSDHITLENSFFDSMALYIGIGGDCHYITFDNCTFDEVDWYIRDTCRFLDVIDSTFYSGFAADTTGFSGVHNVTIETSEFYLSGDTAIYIEYGDNATIIGNTIVNSSDGIRLQECKNAIVVGNHISNITGNGINVNAQRSTVEIRNNHIFNATGRGITADRLDNNSLVASNIVEQAAEYGIRVRSERYLLSGHGYFITVQNNIVENCTGDGMYLIYLFNGTVYNNTIIENGEYGFFVEYGAYAEFWMNILYENGAGNLDFSNSQGASFDNGTHGNFWGPSGPARMQYCDSYDSAGNPWIGDVPYRIHNRYDSDVYDNNPLLHNIPMFLNQPGIIEDIFALGFRFFALNTTVCPREDMWIWSGPPGDTYRWTGGNATFIGTTIEFQSDSSTTQHIIIESGCELRLLGGTKITANNTDATYGFGLRSNSWLQIEDSSIYRCGYGVHNRGFYVNSTGVSFNNVDIYDAIHGMDIRVAVNISNITFHDCEIGLYVQDCSNCNISFLEFDSVDYGVYLQSSTDCHITRNEFSNCNIIGLYIDASSDSNLVEDNLFINLPDTALYVASSDNEIYLNAFVENDYHIQATGASNTYHNGSFGNFYYDYDGADDDGDLIGDTSYSSSISDITNIWPVMIYGNFPTSTGWTVDRLTIALNTNYTMSGNIDVHDILALIGTRLWMNSTESVKYRTVTVYDDGDFRTLGATIKALNSSHRFKIEARPDSDVSLFNTSFVDSHWLYVETGNLVLENVTFTDVYCGLVLMGSHIGDMVLENCTVNTAEEYALHLDECNNVTIRDWVFYSVDYAVYLYYTTDVYVEDIIVQGCRYGVRYQHTTGRVVVKDSYFYDGQYLIDGDTAEQLLIDALHAYRTENRGISCYRVDNATILSSHIEMNGAGTAYEFDDYTDWYLLWNSYAFNGTHGVLVGMYSNGTVDDCEFYNFTTAIRINGYAELNATSSYFYGCTTGFKGYFLSPVIVSGNTFQYCDTAINAHASSNSMFVDNVIENSGDGFYSSETFYDCLVAGNSYTDTDRPIYLEGAHDITIENETITTCTDGITLMPAENITIWNIVISAASGKGIHLQDCKNVSISEVSISDFGEGIHVTQTSGIPSMGIVYVNQTTLTDGDIGIYLNDPALVMRDNVMTGITTTGIEYYDVYGTFVHLDIDTSNTLEGLPIYCLFNTSESMLTGFETYSLAILHSENLTVAAFNLHRLDRMIMLYSDNITIANSTIHTDIDVSGGDYLFIGNSFDDALIYFIGGSNVTFTLNAFLTSYSLQGAFNVGTLNLNGSDYGNYWYNHDGTDANHDGIGDDPFDVPGSNVGYDYLPLMGNPVEYTAYVTIYAPDDGSMVNGMVNVSVYVDVYAGFYYEGSISTSTSITLNGTEVQTGADGQIEFDLDTTQHADGVYILEVIATVNSVDEYEGQIQITIDNTGPILEPSMEDGAVTSQSSPNWHLDASDSPAGVAWLAVYLDGTLIDNNTGSGETGYLYFSLNMAEEKSYELCFRSMDGIGNLAEVNLTIYYDTSNPELSTPDDLSYEEGTTGNTITWEANDLTPSHYNVTIEGQPFLNAEWDGGDIEINVDGLSIGNHLVEINAHDRAGNAAYDYVYVEVTEATTTTTTTTTTGTTTTTTTTTTPPPGGGDILMIGLVVGAIAAVAVIVIIVIKMKKS